MAIIDIEHVTKSYRAHPGTRVLFGKGGLGTLLSRHHTPETAVALTDVSMSIDLGECVGLAGGSGSGKTTLLKLIAGVTTPTSGKITVLGRVAPVLHAEFEPQLSGRENVYLQSRLQGLTLKEANVIMDAVRDFSELGDAIEQPVGSYSTGMRLRLAFAIAAHTSPDILVIGSALGLADTAYQQKCLAGLKKLREQGKTIVLTVDPEIPGFRDMCDRIITLVDGQVASQDSQPGEHVDDTAVAEPAADNVEAEPAPTDEEDADELSLSSQDTDAAVEPDPEPEPEAESDELTLDRDPEKPAG